MEIIILVALLVFVFWWVASGEKYSQESRHHPLDGVTRKEPDLTTIPDGIGHQSILISALDVNKDGKIDAKDAKAAVDATVANAKAIKSTAEAVIKKPRKPRAAKLGKSADDRVE